MTRKLLTSIAIAASLVGVLDARQRGTGRNDVGELLYPVHGIRSSARMWGSR